MGCGPRRQGKAARPFFFVRSRRRTGTESIWDHEKEDPATGKIGYVSKAYAGRMKKGLLHSPAHENLTISVRSAEV